MNTLFMLIVVATINGQYTSATHGFNNLVVCQQAARDLQKDYSKLELRAFCIEMSERAI